MSQPQPITEIQVTLSDGTVLSFGPDEMMPGANYSVSRNFNSPPRKPVKGEPKAIAETWLSHSVHFLTDRKTKDVWEQQNLPD